jgi:hypothetical protein
MHKTRRRRDDLIVRTLTYALMTVAVIGLAVLCLFLVLGYTVDQKTGRAQQGGLIQFRSLPDNANISVDGQNLSFNTPGEKTTDATEHSVKMFKSGYRDWQKSFVLGRGEVLWLNALLVPSSITTNEVERFESVNQTLASPDKKWLAIVEKGNQPLVTIIDLRDEKNPKATSLKIPEQIAKSQTPTDQYVVSQWDFGSRYLLIKHTSGATTEWLRLDRTDEAHAENITTTLKLPFSELQFSGTSGDSFYGLADGALRKVNLTQPLPKPIAADVSHFELYGDNTLAFITQKNNQQTVAVYKDGDQAPTTVETINGTASVVHVALGKYFGDNYLAVSTGHAVTLISQPFSGKPIITKKITLPVDVGWLYFSSNGQFLISQSGALINSYNLERNLDVEFMIPGSMPYTSLDHLHWLDDFHFWSDSGGTLREFEFDGSNPEIINNVVAGQTVTLSNNGKRLFSIGTNTATNQPVLQSSVMVVE